MERSSSVYWLRFALCQRRSTLSMIAMKCACSPCVCVCVPVCVGSPSSRRYNYWEPVHLLLFGTGYQTWEYSPAYALRSYWYPGAAALAGRALASVFSVTPLQVWFALRAMLALASTLCEVALFTAVRDAAIAKRVPGGTTLCAVLAVAQVTCAGMFAASSALLPNSLSMMLYCLAFSAWLRGRPRAAVVWGVASAALGVPFSAILLLPMALHVVLVSPGLLAALPWAVCAAGATLGAQVLLDGVLYGRWVCAVCNLVHYNALSSETDSALYGVEPWTFYAKNLLLNLNVMAPLAVAAGPLVLPWARGRRSVTSVLVLSPLLWLALMMHLPHKEQRFLFPVYPLLLVAGSMTAAVALEWLATLWGRVARAALLALLAVLVVAGGARVAAQTLHRGAPLQAWRSLAQDARFANATICMGDEWHRYPSSFWLPPGGRMRFIRSSFGGLLPKEYAPWPHSTSALPSGMNDRNVGVRDDRVVDAALCDFAVAEDEEAQRLGGHVVRSWPIVDDARSSPLWRALYVPWLSPTKTRFRQYAIVALQSTKSGRQ